MGSQSAVGSPSYRNYQYYGQTQGSSSQQQHEVKRIHLLRAQMKLEIFNEIKSLKVMRRFFGTNTFEQYCELKMR